MWHVTLQAVFMLLFFVIISHRHWESRVYVRTLACLCLSSWPSCCAFLFLPMIGGVSAKLLLIHHPAATGLSCDWTQHTLPPAKMICRPELDSYRLWQGHRVVWHTQTNAQKSVFEYIYYFDFCLNRNASKSAASSFTSNNWNLIFDAIRKNAHSLCVVTLAQRDKCGLGLL